MPFGSLAFGVIVLESGVALVLGDVVERLRERERVDRVVVDDGVLIVESVVVVVLVLGVWSIVPIVPVVDPIVPVVVCDPIVPVVVPVPIDPPAVPPPVVCAEATAGMARAAAAIVIMIRMSVSPANYRRQRHNRQDVPR